MTDIIIDAGTLTASHEDRIVSGLLVPYGEECRSNLGRFTFDSGTVQIPSDVPNTLSFNVEHAREDVIGRGVSAMETPAGIVATFRIADGEAGDKALEDIASGKRTHLSAEVAGVQIKDGKGIAGRLFAAALVERPAFPSATLLAAAADTPDPDAEAAAQDAADTVSEAVNDAEDAQVDEAEDGTVTTEIKTADETVTVIETPNDPEQENPDMADAAAPTTLNASVTTPKDDAKPLAEVIDMITKAHKTQDHTLLAALSDVKISGTGAVGTNITQPEWLGELWTGKDYQRKIVPLLSSAPLTSLTVEGYRWDTKPEVDVWAGNKANVPSNSPVTSPYTETAQRFAGAWDVAREFRDFSVPGFWESFFKYGVESYARKTDAYAATKIVAAATAVTAGTVPSGVAAAAAYIVDGAVAIQDIATPTFALVSPELYRSFLLTRSDDVLAYLSASLGLEEGSVAQFKIVPSSAVGTGKVLVGAQGAATFKELGETPIRVEGLDMVRGGIDPGLFGYALVQINEPDALALVSAGS